MKNMSNNYYRMWLLLKMVSFNSEEVVVICGNDFGVGILKSAFNCIYIIKSLTTMDCVKIQEAYALL